MQMGYEGISVAFRRGWERRERVEMETRKWRDLVKK